VVASFCKSANDTTSFQTASVLKLPEILASQWPCQQKEEVISSAVG
jgi:hypothetical protein